MSYLVHWMGQVPNLPSIPDNSQNINDSVEQLLKLFCDKSVSL